MPSHGVYIAQGVDRCNLSEGVRIIYYRREEIYRLHQRVVGRDLIHAGVVGVVEADQNVGVMLPG